MKKSLIALAFGTLGLGIAEFVMMGILPDVAKDLGISIPTAGHFISAYALGVCVGAPVLQPQYSPMPVEQQIAILYCGTHGLLHDVPLENVQDFERSFIESLQLNHQEDVLDVLRTGVIDDNVTKAIEETAAMVAKQYL